jgi:hypothetical protein
LADRVDEVFDHPDRLRELRNRARETAVAHFDLTTCQLPKWEQLIDDLVNGRLPRKDMYGQVPAIAAQ